LDTINIIPYQTENGVAYTSVETIAATFLGLQAEGKSVGLYEIKILADTLIEELYKEIIIETQTYKYGSEITPETAPENEPNPPTPNDLGSPDTDDIDSFNA
jgi:hypothetical protein